jgi:hypothetical protein
LARLEQVMRQASARIVAPGRVETLDHLHALRGRQHRQIADPARTIARDRGEHLLQVSGPTFDRAAIEQIGRKVERTVQPAFVAGLVQGERQVEFGSVAAGHLQAHLQAWQDRFASRCVLQRQHRLEQRVVTGAAGGIEAFHHLIEGSVLMLEGSQHRFLHGPQEFAYGGVLTHLRAQGQGIDEETDEILDFALPTIGRRRTDDQVLLSTQPGQYDRETGVQHHEEREPFALRKGTQAPGAGGIEHERDFAAAIALHHAARTVERQLQHSRRTGELLRPPLKTRPAGFAVDLVALPSGIVRVLDGQRRQGVGPSLPESGVQHADLLRQHLQRPAVRNDVVHRHQQDVLVRRKPQKTGPEQRPASEVEAAARLAVEDLREGFGCAARQVGHRQGKALGGRFDLQDRAVAMLEMDAQHRMARDDRIQRPGQCIDIDLTTQMNAPGHVVGRAGACELVKQPQPALRIRTRTLLGRIAPRNGRCRRRDQAAGNQHGREQFALLVAEMLVRGRRAHVGTLQGQTSRDTGRVRSERPEAGARLRPDGSPGLVRPAVRAARNRGCRGSPVAGRRRPASCAPSCKWRARPPG